MGYIYSSNLLTLFFSRRSPATEKAYRQDLDHFRSYLNLSSLDEALEMLINLPQSRACLMVMHYKAEMSQQGLKTATINRRISTLRSLVKEARRLKLIPWSLDVINDKSDKPAQPAILTPDQVKRLMEAAKSQPHLKKSIRDYAIIRLIFDLALKRECVSNLTLDDVNLKKKSVTISSSVKIGTITKKLATPTYRALLSWIEVRGDIPGALFTHLDSPANQSGLSSTSIYRIVKDAGERCDLKATPDIIRQAAIFKLMNQAEAFGIDEKEILSFSDHHSIASLKRYRSQKLSLQEKLSRLVSEID